MKHLQQQQILAREASASMKTVKYERRQLIFSNIFGAKWAQLDKNIQYVYSKELKKFQLTSYSQMQVDADVLRTIHLKARSHENINRSQKSILFRS